MPYLSNVNSEQCKDVRGRFGVTIKDLCAFSNGIESWSSQNLSSTQQPCCCFRLYQELVHQICVIFEVLTPDSIAYEVALTSLPLHQFVRPPCWYFRLQETQRNQFMVALNSAQSIPSFIKICKAVLELIRMDRQGTNRQTPSILYAFTLCTSCKKAFN